MLTMGLSGPTGHAAAAAADASGIVGACSQERLTRARGAGFNASGLPDEAVHALLHQHGAGTSAVSRYVLAGFAPTFESTTPIELIGQHLAHAATAYLSSPLADATIVVCDRSDPRVSVWDARAGSIAPVEWPWEGPSFADLYVRSSQLLGFNTGASTQRMEALARLAVDPGQSPVDAYWRVREDGIECAPGWERAVMDHAPRDRPAVERAPLAAALQGSIVRLFIDWLRRVRARVGGRHLCLGGRLFYHSSINSAVRQADLYDEAFVPVDPGVAGLAVGAALLGQQDGPQRVSPFLGPSFSDAEAKATLDNCKLHYEWASEQTTIDIAVDALMAGRLVGWFDGPMEWGQRALGARCILASPHSPFVLENLNHFLKHRESWRGYSLSGDAAAIREHFTGPAHARFMECDFRPRDADAFRHVLPQPAAAIRVHTVDDTAPPRFRQLLAAFGAASGTPILVNTSFNGFQEPIVCSPRDALRVFYGTGLDLLVLGQFVLRK